MIRIALVVLLLASTALAVDIPALEAELRAVETAFARTMADRDAEAFATFLAPDVIFIDETRRFDGAEAVAQGWAPFFEGEAALFSWEPDIVAVNASGTVGLTSGPVFTPDGTRVATFNSVWKREDGRWSIILDRGCGWCE